MAKGTHDYQVDPRNENILISINGELFKRDEAKVSVFDSGYILGDGVWEGIRLHNGKLFHIERHMKRLYEGAKALDMDMGISAGQMVDRIYDTCKANEMQSGVHILLSSSQEQHSLVIRLISPKRLTARINSSHLIPF